MLFRHRRDVGRNRRKRDIENAGAAPAVTGYRGNRRGDTGQRIGDGIAQKYGPAVFITRNQTARHGAVIAETDPVCIGPGQAVGGDRHP